VAGGVSGRGGASDEAAPAGRDRPYGDLVRAHRDRRELSANALARAVGLHPTQLARTEAGTRAPEDEGEVLAVARALDLDAAARDGLLLAAGFWPGAFLALGHEEPALRAVADLLTSPAVPEEARIRFRRAVVDLAETILRLGEAGRTAGLPPGG
jgi:transcriptional regulator with XRE-family HTH domain